MPARRMTIGLIFIALSSLAVLFNNCAKHSSDTSSPSTEVATATEIVGPILSGIRLTTMDGKIQGWAMDKGKKDSILRVLFYLNGDAKTGTYVGETAANVRQPGTYEGHYFSFQVSSDLLDGKSHPVYIYVHNAKDENLVYPAPYGVVGYKPKGPAYYNQNIAPFINSNNCVRCHQTAWTYEALFDSLATPYPISGATSTTNNFYRKMAGTTGHNGGVFCNAGTNASFCPNIEAWWRAEFQ